MKTIKDLEIQGKRVVVRCDFNVPIEDGLIVDNSRIIKSIPTINYLLDNNCKIVLLSHLGRVKSEEDKKKNSLKLVAGELNRVLNRKVVFISACYGNKVREIVENTKDIVLLENTRHMDYPNKLESGNDMALAKYWASLGDVFILDAFGSCHRAHASTAGIAKYIPSAIGFLVENELNHLNELVAAKERPFTIFMGGAKVEDKLPIIKRLITKCDYLLPGGGIANSFLKANGVDVKDSLSTNDESLLKELKELLEQYPDKIKLPVDCNFDGNAIDDLSSSTIDYYLDYINKSKMIFINGTPGKFEDEKYSGGTKKLFSSISEDVKVFVGGGDTVNALKMCGVDGKFYFESSGGGATLEYISSGELEALKWLN